MKGKENLFFLRAKSSTKNASCVCLAYCRGEKVREATPRTPHLAVQGEFAHSCGDPLFSSCWKLYLRQGEK